MRSHVFILQVFIYLDTVFNAGPMITAQSIIPVSQFHSVGNQVNNKHNHKLRIMARIRQSDRALFPIKNVQSVVEIFRNQLENSDEPDLALLSIIVGYIENNLTSNRMNAQLEIYEPVESTSLPALEIDVAEGLYAKFHNIIKSSVDLSLYEKKFATRELIKRVSDVIWNSLTRSYYKDRAHLQSLYSYLTGNKLDCFGVALAVVAGCQVLGYNDVHLALSEDHAWCVFGSNESKFQTAEVTWHGRSCEDRRGSPVPPPNAHKSWLYVNGAPVICTRKTEVAALVSAINPSLNASSDALEVAVVQQRLLWLLYDLGQLKGYPMALGNLGDLEEVCPTSGRPPCSRLFREAVKAARQLYGNQHVYPYTYQGGYFYRRRMYGKALASWAAAADVISQYDYSREDEEIYKEFLEIATELIPYVMRAGGDDVCTSAMAYSQLLRFYDGVCGWEQGSPTPVLHTGWAKAFITCMSKFPHTVRTQVTLICNNDEDDMKTLGHKVDSSQHVESTTTELSHNNNNNNNYDGKLQLHRNKQNENKNSSVAYSHLSENGQKGVPSPRPSIQALTAACSQKILNPEYLLQGGGSPFQADDTSPLTLCEASTSTTTYSADSMTAIKDETSSSSSEDEEGNVKAKPSRPIVVVLRSTKMRGLRSLLVAEKLNTQAIALQLTAQSQVRTKHAQSFGGGDDSHDVRAKRSRRE